MLFKNWDDSTVMFGESVQDSVPGRHRASLATAGGMILRSAGTRAATLLGGWDPAVWCSQV